MNESTRVSFSYFPYYQYPVHCSFKETLKNLLGNYWPKNKNCSTLRWFSYKCCMFEGNIHLKVEFTVFVWYCALFIFNFLVSICKPYSPWYNMTLRQVSCLFYHQRVPKSHIFTTYTYCSSFEWINQPTLWQQSGWFYWDSDTFLIHNFFLLKYQLT